MSQRSAEPIDIGGAATRSRQRHRSGNCCWPKCSKSLWGDAPLCSSHLQIAAEVHAKRQAGADVVWRHTAVITPEQPIEAPAPPSGFVYYLRSSGFIKIGWTSDLAKRMKAYPPDSVLLAVEPGPRQLETRRHRQFAHHRTHGREWYTMAPTLMHHVDSVTAEHGQPEPVAFSAQPVGIPQTRPRQTVGRPARGARHVSG